MRKYRLTSDEERIVELFDNTSIPWIFRSGKYSVYFQWLEQIQIVICSRLLTGKAIDEHTYHLLVHVEDVDYVHKVDAEDLYGSDREFYDNFLAVLKIAEKYYNVT